jgi:peroxiredoxin
VGCGLTWGAAMAGFLEKHDDLKAAGVDSILCMATNDAYVMEAWGRDLAVGDKVTRTRGLARIEAVMDERDEPVP